MCLFQLYHQNDYGSEVSSQTDSLREIILLAHSYGTCFEFEPSIGKSSVDHKVEDLVDLDEIPVLFKVHSMTINALYEIRDRSGMLY